jgi:hypothetical protein
VAGGIQSGTVEGAGWGAFSAAVFFGTGQGLSGAGKWARGSLLGSKLSGAGFAVKTCSHGMAGDTMSHVQGGMDSHHWPPGFLPRLDPRDTGFPFNGDSTLRASDLCIPSAIP